MSGTLLGNQGRNPNIALGSLNRLLSAVQWAAFPTLNVTAPFLGKGGIRVEFDDPLTDMLPAMVGLVNSPAPYTAATLTIELVRSQALLAAYKAQWEVNTTMGNATVLSDSPTVPSISIVNCSIVNARDLMGNGTNPAGTLIFRGTYYINNSLFPG